MSLPARITDLLTSLTPQQVAALPPVERQLLTDQCRRVLRAADAADAKPPVKNGVLARLQDGERAP